MKVLVTGGSGFIGSHLVEHFQGRAEIRVLDDLHSGRRENLDGLDCEFLEGSILDRELVRRAVRDVDLVFHLAAIASVPESIEDSEQCEAVNVRGLRNVLEEATAAGAGKLCLASSAAIYGNNPLVPKIETMPPEPASPYAQTKLDGEILCSGFTRNHRLETVSLRFFNVFGPRQNPRSAYAAVVPIFLQQALENQPLTVHGDGEQTRDFIYVKDVMAALIHVATMSGVTGSYNVGYGRATTVNELARMILVATGSSSKILHTDSRAGDVRDSVACVDKLAATGFRPFGTLESGLEAMFAQGISAGNTP